MNVEPNQHHEHEHQHQHSTSIKHVPTENPAKKHTNSHSHNHHARMIEDYRKKFWISLALTIPILILSPMIQEFVGLGEKIRFKNLEVMVHE